MQRRHFLQCVAVGTLAAIASVPKASAQMRGMQGMGMGGMMGRWITPGSAWLTGLPLQRLDVLKNTSPVADAFEGALVAAPYLASLVSGHLTELWGYNDAFPGPIVELREGQRVAIDFANRLGLDSTVHWHGHAGRRHHDRQGWSRFIMKRQSLSQEVLETDGRAYAMATAGPYFSQRTERTIELEDGSRRNGG